jgi:hypothetical protein
MWYCHRVTTQLQLINILYNMFVSENKIPTNIFKLICHVFIVSVDLVQDMMKD